MRSLNATNASNALIDQSKERILLIARKIPSEEFYKAFLASSVSQFESD